jgi:1-acyl-sn-glycerol-3-phosphate acyltransferase
MRGVLKLLVLVTMDVTIRGLENFPKKGPALVAINHLGDADAVLLTAAIPVTLDGMGKIELSEHWLVGPLFRGYGVIYVHRGQPDRKAIRAALEGLAEGRLIVVAPEGRESLQSKLEEGTNGMAFLAMKSGAPIVPVAMTGTENETIFPNLRKWKRSQVTLTVGRPFKLQEYADRQQMLQEGTNQIMAALANLLPESYGGNHRA